MCLAFISLVVFTDTVIITSPKSILLRESLLMVISYRCSGPAFGPDVMAVRSLSDGSALLWKYWLLFPQSMRL